MKSNVNTDHIRRIIQLQIGQEIALFFKCEYSKLINDSIKNLDLICRSL